MSAIALAVTDGWVVAKRNLIKIKRVPELLIFTTIQPIMFVLLFAYVFGGAIKPDGVNYREYLMAGICAVMSRRSESASTGPVVCARTTAAAAASSGPGAS